MQVEPQLIPAGVDTTVPPPVPALLTASGKAKAAATLFAPSMLTVQGPAPVQAPDQPRKTPPGSAEAVRVTCVPAS